MSLDDHDLLNALYGTEVLQISTAADGSEAQAYVREANGYWYAGDHWEHRGVSAVLVVKQLQPAFVGNKRHTIWEHPAPDQTVEALPLWRRSVVGAEGRWSSSTPANPG